MTPENEREHAILIAIEEGRAMDKEELTKAYEHNLAILDTCVKELIDLKIKATEEYEKRLKEITNGQKE